MYNSGICSMQETHPLYRPIVTQKNPPNGLIIINQTEIIIINLNFNCFRKIMVNQCLNCT